MQTTRYVRSLRNGQITIPADFRQALGLDQVAIVQITLDVDELRIRPYQPDKLETGADWLRDLYLLFDPVRKNVGCLAEEKINKVIDLAFASLRARSLL